MQNPQRKRSIFPGVWHDPVRDVWRTRIRRNGRRSWSRSYPATEAGELKAALAYRTKMNELQSTSEKGTYERTNPETQSAK
jgi:hypothetical protein